MNKNSRRFAKYAKRTNTKNIPGYFTPRGGRRL